MSPLLRYPFCFCEVAESTKWLMDVSEVSALRRHHNHLLCQRTSFSSCSRFFRSTRLIYPNIRHGTPFGNIVRFTLVVGNRHTSARPSMMSMENGESSTTFKGLCKVVWTVEADPAAGQLLYITGDPVVMGCWEPEMAILMSPVQANLWKAEVEISGGVNIKYNYFIKEEMWPYDIIWRSGPELSLSVPPSTKHGKTLIIWDSWIRFRGKISAVHTLQSWIEESFLLTHPFTLTQAGDEEEAVNFHGSNVIAAEPYLNDLTAEDELYSESDVASRMEVKCLESDLMEPEPYLNDPTAEDNLYSKIDLAGAIHNNSISGRCVTERCHPIEEPWLFHSPLFSSVFEGQQGFDVSKETAEDEETNMEDTRKLKPQEESSIIWRDPISTVILINSSLCTMQRIAVLEDGKLVELLLEPVKSNVLCDSIYLGVVTKLVPHMGGAFVNIGGSRPSLMDIKHNREPYIFPPFCQIATKGEANGSVLEVFEEYSNADETSHASLSVQVMKEITESGFGEISAQSLHEDYDEHDIEDDFDAEVLADNMNGSVVSYNEREADGESYSERRENHLGAEAINRSLHVDINGSNDSHMPHLLDAYSSGHKVSHKNKWVQVQKGTKIIVQVVKEGLGTKGPTLTAYPKLRSRFWILITRCDRIGVSKKISGVERTRLKVIAKTLQPQGFGLTVRTVAAGHSLEELQNDLEGLLSTWKSVVENAKSATLAADEGVEGAVPIILHRAMGQTLSIVQDYFNEKVERMVVDSARTYHEVTNYLQEIAPDLCDRVELHDKRIPLFDEYNIEDEINNLLSKRVSLANGGSLVIEQTEALVSIDVNGGHGMFGHGTSQEKAILDVNLAAAKQIARELRLRDIGGIIVVDFIDMEDESNKRLVYEEVKKAVDRDRSIVKVSELSRHGLMEITRKRVRPSVTFMISEPCTCCHGTGRVEALETSFSKIEQEISRMLATMVEKPDPENPKSWPKFILRLDHHMCDYLTSGKRTRLAILSSSLKVWILLKVARGFTRGAFEVKPFADDKANENQHRAATISMLRPMEARSKGPGKRVTLFPIKKWKSGGK